MPDAGPSDTGQSETGRSDDAWFDESVVAAVVAHMNGDHAADNVVICRGLGGVDDATAARMTGMDLESIEFEATAPGGVRAVRIPFSTRLRDRAQVRAEVAALFHRAASLLEHDS